MSSHSPEFEDDFTDRLDAYANAIESSDADAADKAMLGIHKFLLESLLSGNFEMEVSVVDELTDAAYACQQEGDWQGAEAALKKILSLPDIGPLKEFATHGRLALLFRLLRRVSETLRHASLCTAAARRHDVVLTTALELEARCQIRCNQIDEVRRYHCGVAIAAARRTTIRLKAREGFQRAGRVRTACRRLGGSPARSRPGVCLFQVGCGNGVVLRGLQLGPSLDDQSQSSRSPARPRRSGRGLAGSHHQVAAHCFPTRPWRPRTG